MEASASLDATTTPFDVHLSFQGKTHTLPVTMETTGRVLHQLAADALSSSSESMSLKLLYKGKQIAADSDVAVFQLIPKKPPRILVMATLHSTVSAVQQARSDPTIRGFHQEIVVPKKQSLLANGVWGPETSQLKEFKFCRFEACTWQSFGHRPTDTTPHAYKALQLLEQLATDPGIKAVMQERELVVGTLGEMDPLDDRIMHKHQQDKPGSCLLGYNTNAGARIDLKLRTDDLQGFRPYQDLVSTLLHELSHNWVGPHNLLFWTNVAQCKVEYLFRHQQLASTVVNGRTISQIAQIPKTNASIVETVLQDLVRDMAQHGLHPRMLQAAVEERANELLQQESREGGQRVGGDSTNASQPELSARERARVAAEKRQQQQQQDDKPR